MIKYWFKSIFRIDSIYKTNFTNSQQSIAIEKVVITMCLKSVINNYKAILCLLTSTNIITNQLPIVFKAKKSISSSNIRKNMILGTKVTLKKDAAFNFLDLFIFVILPNTKEGGRSSRLNDKGCFLFRLDTLFSFPQMNLFYDKFPKNISSMVNINLTKKNKRYSKLLYTSILIPVEDN